MDAIFRKLTAIQNNNSITADIIKRVEEFERRLHDMDRTVKLIDQYTVSSVIALQDCYDKVTETLTRDIRMMTQRINRRLVFLEMREKGIELSPVEMDEWRNLQSNARTESEIFLESRLGQQVRPRPHL
tara:strand:- start:421 stop:807 length:387 start_codon:yes stop_codon:yes gene_type:complete